MADILIVDDEMRMRHLLAIMLERMGHRVDQAGDGVEALSKIDTVHYDMIISDIKMPRMSGQVLLERLKEMNISCPLVFITAFATVESAVEMMRMGAADYITKPFEEDRIQIAVARTLNLSRIIEENKKLKNEILSGEGPGEFVCFSSPMKQVLELASRVAQSDSAVLILGESGTGKELMARFIHHESLRKKGRFVALNCAAISPQLVESELFGYEKGAFTGAVQRSLGKFEFAQKGTIFLDEIGDLPLDAQAKLLRALQEKKIRRVGGNEEIDIDTRVLCASNRNLEAMVEDGRFRQDLFFRINVFPIEIPPLRDRKEDILPLCEHFLKKLCKVGTAELSEEAKNRLQGYHWPGNVRELANAMERALIIAPANGLVGLETLHFLKAPVCMENETKEVKLPATGMNLEAMEMDLVRQALESAGDNQTLAAGLLGLTRAKFRVLMKKAKESE